jgi:type I restriction enzyme S subunit
MDADLFLQQFGHLAQGEGGIKKLRDVILQLAVRGKLVEQNPADEPAEVLLKKVAVARKNFASDYKLNTSKENQPVIASQMPYELPYSWQWVRLSNIGIIVGGGTPSSGNPEYFCDNGGIAWLTPADMYALKSKFISHGRRDLTHAGLSNSSAQLMPKGSILFSSRAPIGYVAIAANEATTNQGFKSCVPFIGEMSEYIYYYLKSAVRYIESLASGTTFMEVSGKVVSNVLFPLPPLAEQKRIVAKVDELMALCDKLEAEQKAQRTLKTQAVQSTLHHLTNAESPASFGNSLNILERTFGNWFDNLATVKHLRATILQLAVHGKLVPQNPTDEPASELLKRIEAEKKRLVKEGSIKKANPLSDFIESDCLFELPNGWVWERLGNIGETNIGLTYSPNDIAEQGIPVLRSNNIKNGKLNLTDLVRVKSEVKDSVFVNEGDLLICARNGSRALVGKTAIIKGLKEPAAFGAFMAIFRSDLNDYLYHFICSPLFRQVIEEVNTTTINQITQANLRSTLAPIPPLAEQKRIVAKVDELMTLCDQLEAHITHTQTLNTHLMDSLIHRMTEAA